MHACMSDDSYNKVQKFKCTHLYRFLYDEAKKLEALLKHLKYDQLIILLRIAPTSWVEFSEVTSILQVSSYMVNM